MTELLARWRAHRRLHRGRCRWVDCQAVLRDDQPPGFCSPECEAADQLEQMAW